MLKKKEGFTNRFEENALRESALIISEETKICTVTMYLTGSTQTQ